MQGGVCGIRRDGGARGIDNLAPAKGVVVKPLLDGIPVDERKRRALVVKGDPGSAPRFRRRDYGATVHNLLSRGKAGGTHQLFVAIHPKTITPSSRDERDGAHGSGQSAAG